MGSKGKIKTTEFLRHIEILAQNSTGRIVDGFDATEKQLLDRFLRDTQNLIEHDEWGIGLENLLNNICDIDFKIDHKALELAKEALEACKMDYDSWKFIEALVD